MNDLGLQSIFGVNFLSHTENAEEEAGRGQNILPPINFSEGTDIPQTRRRTNRRSNNANATTPIIGIKEREFLHIDTLIPDDLCLSSDNSDDEEDQDQGEGECIAGLPLNRNYANAHRAFCFLCKYKDREGGNNTKLQVITKMIYDMYVNPEENVRPTTNAVSKAIAEYYENEIRRPILERRGVCLPIWKRASIIFHILQIPDPRPQFFGADGWLSDIRKEVRQLKRMGYERITTDDDKKTIIINTDAHRLKIEYMKLGLALSCKDPKKMANYKDKSSVVAIPQTRTMSTSMPRDRTTSTPTPGPVRVQRPPER